MSGLRLFVEAPLEEGQERTLADDAARHVQVRRLQPGDALVLFDGRGGEWSARVLGMGRRSVDVVVGRHAPGDREPPFDLRIAVAMPANERMDALVEKATELGVSLIQPLVSERSVLRLEGDRAERRVAHWQGVAAAACEQCGRTRVPDVRPVQTLGTWLASGADPSARGLLMTPAGGRSLARLVLAAEMAPASIPWLALSGPEGGLTAVEEDAARAAGFEGTSLGPLVLRADTAPLVFLAQMGALLGVGGDVSDPTAG